MGVLICPKCKAMAEDNTKDGAISKIDHASHSKKCDGKDEGCLWYPKTSLDDWKENATLRNPPKVETPTAGRPIQGMSNSDKPKAVKAKITKGRK